jgi:hypothetical protein
MIRCALKLMYHSTACFSFRDGAGQLGVVATSVNIAVAMAITFNVDHVSLASFVIRLQRELETSKHEDADRTGNGKS